MTRLPMFTREGSDRVLKTVAIFGETGAFAHLSDTTTDDLAALLQTMDEEQLAEVGVRPLEDE